ncbi:MAG TPA: BON domain-containing protein, partial [Blastocatellia bacterium]|nr:BON domain-containing protein [Blastocatellia bacterium]
MFDQQLSCAACGEKLNATMSACPRCGALRSVAVVDDPEKINANTSEESKNKSSEATANANPDSVKTSANVNTAKNAPPLMPAFYLAPADEKRRTWTFNKGLLKPIAIGLAILAILGTSVFSYWRYSKNREMQELIVLKQAYEQQQKLQENDVALPETPLPLPSVAPVDDPTLTNNVRVALSGYDVLAAATKYKYEVKEGVVTLSGQADNQAEKDGVENVVKGVSGVKAVINTMTVKNPGDQISVVGSSRLSEAEAKRLEDILSKEQAENQRRAEEERRKQVLLDDER